MIINTRHFGIVVQDIEKSIKFYEGLGMTLQNRMVEEGPYIDKLVGLENVKLEWAKLKIRDNSVLELLKYHNNPDINNNSNKVQNSNKLGCSHIAFTVLNINDTISYISSSGGNINKKVQISPDKKVKVAYCYDIEGNLLEIVQELK